MLTNFSKLLFAVCIVGLTAILTLLSFPAQAQGIQKSADGNYFSAQKPTADTVATLESLTKAAAKTGTTFTTTKNEVFPIYQSKTGALYVVRTSKKGTFYRQYMPKG